MRHWQLGFPIHTWAPVCGRPCQSWITLFMLCHARSGQEWRRVEWPDGNPLLAQSWPLVALFRIIADELQTVAQEEHKRRHRR